MSETTKPHKQTNRSNQATSYGTKKEWHSKNCGHKLLHLTHDSNNNRRDEERKKERKMANVDTKTTTNNNNNNLSNHTDKVTHIEREREREKATRSTQHT
jgi:hypothetical protein